MTVVGIDFTFHRSAMVWPSSQPMANVAPFSFAKSATPPFSSSTETPTISTFPACFFESSSSFGNDVLQGAHQVAQKSTMAILPLSESLEIFPLPLMVWIERSGAGLPTDSCCPPPSLVGAFASLLLPPQPVIPPEIARKKDNPSVAPNRSKNLAMPPLPLHPSTQPGFSQEP